MLLILEMILLVWSINLIKLELIVNMKMLV
jgi:hypothetical protein